MLMCKINYLNGKKKIHYRFELIPEVLDAVPHTHEGPEDLQTVPVGQDLIMIIIMIIIYCHSNQNTRYNTCTRFKQS